MREQGAEAVAASLRAMKDPDTLKSHKQHVEWHPGGVQVRCRAGDWADGDREGEEGGGEGGEEGLTWRSALLVRRDMWTTTRPGPHETAFGCLGWGRRSRHPARQARGAFQ